MSAAGALTDGAQLQDSLCGLECLQIHLLTQKSNQRTATLVRHLGLRVQKHTTRGVINHLGPISSGLSLIKHYRDAA